MAADERWYFTKEQLQSSPSRKCGIDADKELSYRQQAANFIQDMGQRLPVNQLCINTAIVYMHRFYMFHSFTKFHRNAISTCALFLAAKVEEQPRKLEHVIKVAHMCLNKGPSMDTKTEAYLEQAQQLVMNENIMLQTLGFDVAIDHPHTHIVKCCQLVRASKDLAQTSYIMATNSLHLTTMCLQYKPTIVACVCIHLACKWSSWEIPYSTEGKDWFWYVEKYITLELLEDLTAEFLSILDKFPTRLNKRKILNASKEMVADKKGKMDANCYDAGIPLSLMAPNEKNRSPMLKQEKNDRPDRIERMKIDRYDRVDRSDKNDWAESSTSDKLDRSEKQNRTERQPEKMIKFDRTERFDRHERLEKNEKEKHDRAVERERSDKQLKPGKTDHPIRIEHSDKVNEPKETKNETPVTSCHSTSSESHHVNMASMQNPLKLPGFIPSTTDSKSAAAGDGSNIPIPGVSKKHRYNASKQSSSKEHREHKERREKEQFIDKERQSQLPNFHPVQPKTPPLQPLIRQEKVRHRKEEMPIVRLTDIAIVNNQCDVRASNLNIPQEKLKDTPIKNQLTHQNEHKQHSESKQRTKHPPCTYEKNVVLSETKPESMSEEEKTANPVTSNEMKKIKTVTPEGKMNSSVGKSEKSSMHPRISQQFLSQDKHLQEILNKSSEQASAPLPSSYVHTHPQQIPGQKAATPTPAEKPNVMPEKHERHERKEKHKHKDRDREKAKEKREAIISESQDLQTSSAAQQGSSGTSQRIKLTIPKERLNSKSTNSSESSRKKSSPPKDMPLKLKISKEMLTATPTQKKSNDIPKLKIKIPKDPALYSSNKSSEKTESRKRERDSSPKNLNLKNSPKSPKIPRIETRSSRKDDGSSSGSTQSLLSLPMPPEPVATNSRSSKNETPSKTNGSNTSAGGNSFPHFSRKSSSSKVNDNYKNKSHVMPTAYQQIQMNAGPYPYAQYYPYPTPMSGYFPHPPPPTGDFHNFYGQNFHMGPPLPPPPPDHGPPPLPREPPPPTPPPPPE